MSSKSRYRAIRRQNVTKPEPQGYTKDANAVYRGILRDRSKRRYSKPHVMQGLGKLLTFDWDLFITDIAAKPLSRTDLHYGHDYLILRGGYAGRIARFVGTEKVKRYGSFVSVRGNEMRVNCAEPGFAAIPKLGCWMEPISSKQRLLTRPPILLIQAKSIVGDLPKDEMHFAVREGNDLIAQWTYRKKVVAEAIDLPKVEQTLVKLGSHEMAHPTLAALVERGFYVCYEDDGWLVKCEATQRLRFMRRSHLYSLTVCRCGHDVVNAMMDDYTLRALLPVRMFAGLPGLKQSQRPGHLRRSSSMMSSLELDISDLVDDYDKSACYARIFNREGATAGNCLVLDTPFLDATRSFLEHGGMARHCVCPNIVKWRRMVKYAASADEPYLGMAAMRIVNGQWADCLRALPNSNFKRFSFSVVFYDGSTKQDSPKIAHKVLKPVKPKDDIAATFQKRLFMNGAYICIALSRRNVSDESLPTLFDNVEEFVKRAADANGYAARRCALGVHINKQIYVDFQVFIKTNIRRASRQRKGAKRKKAGKRKSEEMKYDGQEETSSAEEEEDEESESEDEQGSIDEEDEEDYYDDEDENDPSFYSNTHR